MVAKFNSKCQDRCGLPIHAGHDEIERGHYGFRHVDCEQAHLFAWIRERLAAGDLISDVQIKLATTPNLTPELRMTGSIYALDYENQEAA